MQSECIDEVGWHYARFGSKETRIMVSEIPPAQDLIEFHLRWKEFRPSVVKLCERVGRQNSEGETLHWLIAMADRVGPDDLNTKD